MIKNDLYFLPDAKLLELIQQDNRDAFDQIYNRYWEKLFLYVAKVVRDSEEAQDIVQEVFVSLWERRQKLGTINSLSAYLFAASRYKGLSYVKAHLHKNRYMDSIAAFFSCGDNSLDEQQSVAELATFIDRQIEKLPSKMREIFILSRKENLSYKEISTRLQISDKTVKKQISNALKLFRLKVR